MNSESDSGSPLPPVVRLSPATELPESEIQGGDTIPAPKVVPTSNMLRTVHDALRGRYLAVVSAGLLVGAIFAAAGWKLARPMYTSEGIVQIAYAKPTVRQATDQNEPLPMFDTLMQSQKMLISSRGVIDLAIVDPAWHAYNRPVPDQVDQFFSKHMTVEVKRPGDLIRITVEDVDPATAAAATTAIVNSYYAQYIAHEAKLDAQRLNKLKDDQNDLDQQIEKANAEIDAKAQEFGTADLGAFYSMALSRVNKLSAAIDDLNIAVAGVPAPSTAKVDGNAATAPAEAALDPQMIAMSDGVMRAYLEQQDRCAQDLERLQKSYPDTNPKILGAKDNLERAKQKVGNYAEMYRLFHKATAQNLGQPGPVNVATAGMTPETLRANIASLQQLLAASRAEMVSIGVKKLDIEKLLAKLAKLKAERDVVETRIDVLSAENSLGSRLRIVSTGEMPLSPSTDKRLRMAGLAGVGGFLLPAATVFLLSLVRRRYRYVDDTSKDSTLLNVPLLGMLPEVGRKFDAEVLHATAHGIHQMRVLLCAKSPRNSKRSYLITSATEGEGKTNLTVALGMSFAAARQRTLVIDCDFVGRRLTRGFKADNVEGLLEAMRDGSIGDRVRQESPRFFVLPTGKVASTDACAITTENIRDLLAQTRDQYDTVIIDTGPILGSLEAAVVAQEVDGVILAISRGQHPTLVQHALRRLESVRAVLAGAVFNRAKLQDFHSSAYTSSQTSTPYVESVAVERAAESSIFADFGPLVRAVSLGTPAAA